MKVYVNVYDIIKYNKYVDCAGIGVYHTGIEVNGSEYAYGGNSLLDSTGVYEMIPKQHDVFMFKDSILVGEVEREDIIWSSLSKMMKKFKANQYDMLKQNCNHFTHEFLVLLIGRGLPRHLNRIAYVGSFFHCIVPKKYLIVTPQQDPNDKQASWDVVDSKSKNSKNNSKGSTNDGDEFDDSDSDGDEDNLSEEIKSDEDSLMFDDDSQSQNTKANTSHSRSSTSRRRHRSKSQGTDKSIAKNKKPKQTKGCKDKLFSFLKFS